MNDSETLSFHLPLHSPRWGHDDQYSITLSHEGLTIRLPSKSAHCDVDDASDTKEWSGFGVRNPFLSILLDNGNYAPAAIPGALEWVFDKWRGNEWDEEEVIRGMQELFAWIDATTKAKPNSEFWSEYF